MNHGKSFVISSDDNVIWRLCRCEEHGKCKWKFKFNNNLLLTGLSCWWKIDDQFTKSRFSLSCISNNIYYFSKLQCAVFDSYRTVRKQWIFGLGAWRTDRKSCWIRSDFEPFPKISANIETFHGCCWWTSSEEWNLSKRFEEQELCKYQN